MNEENERVRSTDKGNRESLLQRISKEEVRAGMRTIKSGKKRGQWTFLIRLSNILFFNKYPLTLERTDFHKQG